MTFAGVDLGTSGVRAVVLDERLEVAGQAAEPLDAGRRRPDGGHRLDEDRILDAGQRVLVAACSAAGARPAAISAAGTAGTLCFRDRRGRPAGEAVAYDDGTQGAGLERVRAWLGRVEGAARVVPIADALLERLGADPAGTDWTSALKLGWAVRDLAWPEAAADLDGRGALPSPAPPAAHAGRAREPELLRGALLVRGATDGCAMQVAAGPLRAGAWAVSMGTTLTWKTVLGAAARPDTATAAAGAGARPDAAPAAAGAGARPDAAPAAAAPAISAFSAVLDALPPGAYAHRLTADTWLPGAAGNSGGGVLTTLLPGADLAAGDAACRFPSGFAAYPLARPGERFPLADRVFAGFGLPPRGDPRLHAAVLEGVAFVIRRGVDVLTSSGVPAPRSTTLTGGGAASPVWADVVAAVLGLPVDAAPRAGPALGAALLAAAAWWGVPAGVLAPAPRAVARRRHDPDRRLGDAMAPAYAAFERALERREPPD